MTQTQMKRKTRPRRNQTKINSSKSILSTEVRESNRKLNLSSPRKRGSSLSTVDSRLRGNDKEKNVLIAFAKVNKRIGKIELISKDVSLQHDGYLYGFKKNSSHDY